MAEEAEAIESYVYFDGVGALNAAIHLGNNKNGFNNSTFKLKKTQWK